MTSDREFIQILDAALADSSRRSGAWLVCKPGCSECCMGPFAITQLDAARLREGLAALEAIDPQRAHRVRSRSLAAIERMKTDYPGDPVTGILDDDAEDRFPDTEETQACPALDPDAGTCDLYSARPVTCRTFGPPVSWGGEAVGICDLCFHGATDEQIASCEVRLDIRHLEAELLPDPRQTTVAFALRLK